MKQRGFTLVELSIVLVILGLLVGGVLSGQSLIKAAELRSVTTQFNGFITATNAFQDKYFGLPGDIPNATNFWGVANATPATCRTTISTDQTTCNGDGNGAIEDTAGSLEVFRYWQQLANAGLIEGKYTGTRALGGDDYYATKDNQPASRIQNALWGASYTSYVTGNGNVFDGAYGNFLYLGTSVTGSWTGNVALSAEDAYNIDRKMDDGKPGMGNATVYCRGGLANCSTTSDPAAFSTAEYNLTNKAISVTPYYRNAF